ncbi:hypothetical protein [Maribacter sp. 2210JD10-5]|uniref:hypothetical protein n=1 Tax=Maribacter sp. 2210JD10-5 TaxID=3386272 RepID=UPI0039BD27DF
MSEMYTGKSSRNPNMPFIYYGLLGLALIGFGIYEYFDIAAWEVTTDPTEEHSMHLILWEIYDLGGKNAILGLFSLLGLGGIFAGWHKTKELKRIKEEAIH